MRLAQPTMLDLLRLAADARPDEIAQYEALTGREWNVDAVANEHYNRVGLKFVLVGVDGAPVVAGGYDLIIPGVWESWMIGTMDNWRLHWLPITRAARRIMDRLLADGARRLQTEALASRTGACDWYTHGLKMTPEGVRKGFGMNGEDVALFARTRTV